MRLLSIAVWSWKGLDHAALDDLAPDLTLVVGPNEAGKSRLFTALHYALFERYKGESEDKKALRTWGSSDPPRVVLRFEAEGVVYTLEKQFLRGAKARLEGGGKTLVDDDAEARLREIWGTRVVSGRRDVEQFLGLWPLVWVRQGRAWVAPHGDLNDDTRGRLRDRLTAQVSEVTAGPLGERVVARAEEERARYWTATWKETGELSAARARSAEAEARLAEATARREEAHGAAETLAKLRAEATALTARTRLQRDAVAAAAARAAAARELAGRVKAHEGEVARLRAEVELAARALDVRRELSSRSAALDAELAAADEALARAGEQKARVLALAEADSASVREAEADAEAAHALHLRARQRARRDEASTRAVAAQQALARARKHEEAVRALRGELAQIRVDERVVKRLRQTNDALSRASAALLAASARVRVEALRDLVVDGAELAAGAARAFTCDEPRRITIAGVAVIAIEPGGASLEASREASLEARRALDEALAAAGVRSLDAAEEAYARRTALAAQLTQAEALFRDAAPQGTATLEDEVRTREASLGALEAEGEAPPLEHADAMLREATDRLARARAVRDARREEAHRQNDGIARAEATRTQLARERHDVRARLDVLPTREALADAHDAARARLAAAEEVLRALVVERTGAAEGEAALRLQQDQSVLTRLEAEQAEGVAAMLRLEALLEVRGGEDLHEHVQRAETEAATAARELAKTAARAEAVRALVTALHAARREMQERLLAPVLDRVHPYLQALLPGARVRMDDEWRVLGLTDRDREEEFEALSAGAKEQVSILVRLALAEVLGEGVGLPIVLDDALVNTDEGRHADMLRVLYRASRKQQILLFTCHDVAWERLGETRRIVLPARRAR